MFDDVFDAAPAEELGNELTWYAEVLGQVRDRDILSSRLTKEIAELPPEQVRGPVEAEIKKTLPAEHEEAVGELSEAMRTSRYAHLVQLLRGWRAAPPLTEAAGEEAQAAVKYVEKAKQKADKRLRKADDDIERLHRARRATKRTRYAAELVEPADSEMNSSDGDGTEGTGFTYGILMASELNRAAQIRASLRN